MYCSAAFRGRAVSGVAWRSFRTEAPAPRIALLLPPSFRSHPRPHRGNGFSPSKTSIDFMRCWTSVMRCLQPGEFITDDRIPNGRKEPMGQTLLSSHPPMDVDTLAICAHSYVGYANGLAYSVSTMGREPCKVPSSHTRLRGGNAVVWPDRLSYDFKHPLLRREKQRRDRSVLRPFFHLLPYVVLVVMNSTVSSSPCPSRLDYSVNVASTPTRSGVCDAESQSASRSAEEWLSVMPCMLDDFQQTLLEAVVPRVVPGRSGTYSSVGISDLTTFASASSSPLLCIIPATPTSIVTDPFPSCTHCILRPGYPLQHQYSCGLGMLGPITTGAMLSRSAHRTCPPRSSCKSS